MCKWIDDIPGFAPGWGCCKCRAYNSPLRERCKMCGTPVCAGALPDVVEVVVPRDVFSMFTETAEEVEP